MDKYASGKYASQSQYGAQSQMDRSMGATNYVSNGSPTKGHRPIPNAGILNSKTLAEENLKGFRLRNL